MENYISLKTLKNAELLLRVTMIVVMLVAGISKICSHGNFHDHYLALFTKDNLRIQLPGILFHVQLTLIPFIELGLGGFLLISIWAVKIRRSVIVMFVTYIISLITGHYILEEWIGVDVMMPYILLGVAAYILPPYKPRSFIK